MSTALAVRSVTFVRFVLNMAEPGGVSVPAPARRSELDSIVETDPHGLPHLPGTSLAGALRGLVHDHGPDGPARARRLFGHVIERGEEGYGEGDTVDSVASRVWVLGSQLIRQEGPAFEPISRWSTAIDRRRAAARPHTLRGDEVLPAGTCFEVFLRWDDDVLAADRDVLLALLGRWSPLLGRGVSRGFGRCEVQAGTLRRGTLHLDEADDLLRWLTMDGPDLVRAVAVEVVEAVEAVPDQPGTLLEATVTIVGPLHLGTGKPKAGEPAKFRRERDQYLIPGAGLKGVIRSRVEYILRSVGLPACEDQRCGSCRPCEWFGHGGGNDTNSSSVGARARVRFTDAPVDGAVARERTHVAIDRFTGGSAMRTRDDDKVAVSGERGGLLYSVEVVESGTFRLVISDLGLAASEWAELAAFLRLVLDDLNDGLIGIGRGTARGYGSIRVDTTGLPSSTDARGVLRDLVDRQKEAS